MKTFTALLALALGGLATTAQSATPLPPAYPAPTQGDYTISNFHFRSGETLPTLRLHYMTIGTPIRNGAGEIINAVLVLHGTGGSGRQFLSPQFANELYGPGQLLDAAKYFIVLPDDIGHGKSSKPSDGQKTHFPHYDYADMVEAEHALVTKGLGVTHLRLIMGTSMGCMHAFMWGETWPDAARALQPMACLPTAIVGRNRLWRTLLIEAIKSDPAWRGGDYDVEPRAGLTTAEDILTIAGSAPHQMQKALPTPEAVNAYVTGPMASAIAGLDANDLIYQVDSSRDYDPSAHLEAIKAPVMWINSADDFINPPELGLAETLAPRLAHGRYVLLPTSTLTHGHGTHTWAVAWKSHLAELLDESASSEP
jgi:homoserine O-acetyltransferase